MQKWEYAVETLSRDAAEANQPAKLRVLGENGWELVAVIPEGEALRVFLKRPVYPRLDPEVEKLVSG